MKIVPVLLRYDYGLKSRGDSLEYRGFYSGLKQITEDVYPFWYDEYLSDKTELQKKVIEYTDKIKPDIVFFVLMKDEFFFETLDYLGSKYRTVNWFCDDQWRFDDFTRYYAPHFSYSITTDKFAFDKYKKEGYRNVILSQWGAFESNKNIDFDKIEYAYDVSFIGMISGYRKWIINKLIKNGIKVECFGSGWANGQVSYEKMKNIIMSSKINLNISNSVIYDIRYVFSSPKSLYEYFRSKKRIEQIKARNFEIPALGGFQLTNYAVSLEDNFKIGEEVAVYSAIEDLLLQINYFLRNENKRKEIMINGFKRAANKYNYFNRLKEVFEKIEIKK